MTDGPHLGSGPGQEQGRASRRSLLLKWAFLLAGSIGLTFAFVQARGQADAIEMPAWPTLIASALASMAGITLLGVAWIIALEARSNRLILLRGFFISQLGKYIPGGIWQPAGQIGFALGHPLSSAGLWTRFAGFALCMITGAGVVAAGAALLADLPLAVRFGGLLAAGSIVLVLPPVTTRLEALIGRLMRRDVGTLLPPGRRQSEVVSATAGLAVYSVGFAVIMQPMAPAVSYPSAVAAFALAWLCGFLALPVPAGVGVREAILVAALGGSAGTGPVLAASVAYRVVCIAGEGLLVVTTASLVHGRRLRTNSPEGDLRGR